MGWSESRLVDRIWVGATFPDYYPSIDRVVSALMLIKQHDLDRYRRLQRDIDRIWVFPISGAVGQYTASIRSCQLDSTFVRKRPIKNIASTIVHEATHAHPCLRKVGYSEPLRHRVEGICMRRELAFANCLPNSENLRQSIEKRLALNPSFWTNDAIHQRYKAAELESAHAAGVPEWQMRWAQRLGRGIGRFLRLIG